MPNPGKYSLSASAREAFYKFAKPQENIRSLQGAEAPCHAEERRCSNTKSNKHVLRIALNMHIFYDRVDKTLNHETGPTDQVIHLPTLNMAVSFIEVLETYKGILEIVSF